MKIRIFYILLLGIILVSAGCSKSKLENKIVGDWTQLSVGQNELKNKVVVWTFTADHKIYRSTTYEDEVTIDTASWSLNVKFAQKNILTIENLDPMWLDGKHIIHELDDYMKLQRVEFTNGHSDGSFYWSEFEKK